MTDISREKIERLASGDCTVDREYAATLLALRAALDEAQPDPLGYALAIEQAAADEVIAKIWANYGNLSASKAVIRSLMPPANRLAAVLAMTEVRAVIRQAMAAYQMAYNEADRDVETPEEADRIAGLWFAKWMVESYPLSHETEAHSGDCTKQPWSCLRCHAEGALASVDASLKEWDRLAAAMGAKEGNA